MNAEEKEYFSVLTKSRSTAAEVLSQSFLSGIWKGIVDKYRDQAHFIYELLQNADDVGATYATFLLYDNRLIFKHNGTRHFHVTNPDTEEEDRKNGKLGDLNSISSAAQSSKEGQFSIGKFGVGFKAVFQYTSTPHIYDPNVAFKIERYIVPMLIDGDCPGRKANETVFVFPFDHKERKAEEAFEDIADKLRHLVFPILFLNHLRDISFEIKSDSAIGMYEKNVLDIKTFGDITAEKTELTYTEGENIVSDVMWLFSRKNEANLKYSVGFFLDENDKLKPVNMPAFCFFPTKEDTKLHFIVHAPFLLTDSREGIKAGEEHNKKMISLLADLAAEALFCIRDIGTEENIRIIDDDIINIIPVDNTVFTNIDDRAKISFRSIYDTIQKAMKQGLLPTKDGYAACSNSYWSDTLDLNNMFSDEQLAQLYQKDRIHWVFRSKPRHAFDSYRNPMRSYIDGIVCEWLDEKKVLSHIDGQFIKKQSFEWLHGFYQWIAETPRRFDLYLKDVPIFINAQGEPAAAYDENGQSTLFLPSFTVKDCPTIHPDLLKNPETRKFLLNVVMLKEPSLQDYINNTVIPHYQSSRGEDPFEYFKLFFSYYKECKATDIDSYIEKIKELDFLEYYDKENNRYGRCKASELYYPEEELVEYFSATPSAHFLALKKYETEYPNDGTLISFINELGIRHNPKIYQYDLTYQDMLGRKDLPRERSTAGHQYFETRIEGAMELAEYVASNMAARKSLILWKTLQYVIDRNMYFSFNGKYEYFYYSRRCDYYKSLMVQKLQGEKWLLDKDGNFVNSTAIKASELSPEYDVSSDGAQKLIKLLEFQEEETLTEEEKFARMCRQYGVVSEDELREFQEWKRQKALPLIPPKEGPVKPLPEDPLDPMTSIAKDITSRAKKPKKAESTPKSQPEPEEIDRDEYTPGAIDYDSKIEAQKEKQADELQELAQMQKLQETALSADKYSYLWFKTLLDMEILNSDADSSNSREISISFGAIEKELGTQKTYVLKHPSKYIPQYMEDLSDIPLAIRMKDGSSKTVAIEVASVQSYNLHVKLKDAGGLSGIDLPQVQEVSIKAAKPVFLLQALKDKLSALKDASGDPLEDGFNMRDNLPENLEFVFGPPGTGKTTYLANQVLMPLMKQKEAVKVLVLTPTNKAADVLTTRIMDGMGKDTSYTGWLTRFGITGDERIEGSEVLRDKTFDIRTFSRSVTVTTIARFAYDFFMPKSERLYLDALNWDYIVIDEASMIPIVQIIYPLYRKTPKKLIIAGDPFQIEPITTAELWAGENIYKMVELDSFTEPKTVPHAYPVIKLTTQYRSTPEIGEVFSKFTYGGILSHNRNSASRRDLHLNGIIDLDSLNVLKFPVSKYESIYRPKRLNGTTPYQTYSAIFTMEFADFLSKVLSERNPGEKFTIGIVAPYKAQASLIDRLMSSVRLPAGVDVQVGTIHGFQGDECDAVIVVFNPPPSITNSPRLFLNKQNVLNVAISRARDYLFVIMPDNQTENIFRLHKIKTIEDLMRNSGHFSERATSDVEQLIFGDEKYIENNSFATSHQTVNVYGQPEKRYEIRSEDTAVDVQVHRTSSVDNKPSKDKSSEEPPKEKVQPKDQYPKEPPKTVIFAPDKPDKSAEKTTSDYDFMVGMKVRHKTMGEGKIHSMEKKGTATEMVVRFPKADMTFPYPGAIQNGSIVFF